jgi:hypothetical protein
MTGSAATQLRNRRPGLILSLVLLACVALSMQAAMARTVRVYEVDVAGQSPGALQDAMRQALVRATGHREAANDPALASIVEDAPKYVKSYAKGAQGQNQVVFDGAAVERAITAAGRGVWSADRPFTLVALYPPLPRAAEEPARAELEQEAARRGLLISLIPLTVVDASGSEVGRDALLSAAQRYGADQVLVGRTDKAPVGQWRWTLHTGLSSQSWNGPLIAGVDGTVDALVPQGSAALAQADAETRVQIDGVAGLSDYASVERILQSVPGVRRARIAEVQGTQAVFELTVRGGAEALDRALSGSTRLARSSASNGTLVYLYHP